MKILWLERIEALLWEKTAAVGRGQGGRTAARTGLTVAEHQPTPTNSTVAAE
jgi:hypothetical protein